MSEAFKMKSLIYIITIVLSALLLFVSNENIRLREDLKLAQTKKLDSADSKLPQARELSEDSVAHVQQSEKGHEQKLTEIHKSQNTSNNGSDSDEQSQFVDWKISALDKLVSLSDKQREMLRKKYSSSASSTTDPLNKEPSLKDILGAEDYENYVMAKERAKEKVKSEDLEKEVLFVSSRLGLSVGQQENLRNAVFNVDEKISALKNNVNGSPGSFRDKFTQYLLLERTRRDLLKDELQKVFDKKTFENYVKLEADSAAVELELWHGK